MLLEHSVRCYYLPFLRRMPHVHGVSGWVLLFENVLTVLLGNFWLLLNEVTGFHGWVLGFQVIMGERFTFGWGILAILLNA